MTKFTGDIDIDVADRDKILPHFRHVKASIVNKLGVESVHNVGVYFQDIPSNPIAGRATFDYKVAEDIGYQKIDVLNNSIYSGVRDMAHLGMLSDVNMMRWDLLEDETIVDKMPHIRGHFDVVSKIRPHNIDDLAIVLALIRPAKRHLLDESITEINKNIWVKPTDGGYYFKKSHSYAFALSLIVKLNLMVETYDGI